MRLGSIMWSHYVPMLVRGAKRLDFVKIEVFPSDVLDEDFEKAKMAVKKLQDCDVILLYCSTEPFWKEIEKDIQELSKEVPIIAVGYDPSYWALSTVRLEVVAKSYSYITISGEENFARLLCYIAKEVLGLDVEAPPPKPVPWQGIYHPNAPSCFSRIEDFLEWYKPREGNPTVGIFISRHYWVTENLEIEDFLIKELEDRGANVIPVFSYSLKNEALGSKGQAEVIREFFFNGEEKSRIDALIRLTTYHVLHRRKGEENIDNLSAANEGAELLKKLDVPIFQPVISSYRTLEEWETNPHGLGMDISWSITMPEFGGMIEPIMAGGVAREEEGGTELKHRAPIEERCQKITRRVLNWIKLKNKPILERRVVFILHNNPCASVEATVGSGAHLDTLESVARIMQRMQEAGYRVKPPKNGKELIDLIMERKAISEFRWTTVEEIVKKGGALALVLKEDYDRWFDILPERVKKRMNDAWGEPPGREMDGVPAAMVYEGKMVVTGVQFGNAVICVQPKRGCAGPRCDGRVCKILHDPEVPPPHQYFATYRWLEQEFGTDVIIHVGTHGNLEFLPGKGTGLSNSCFPDIGIGDLPHLYIYNSDNPAEGTIAKRRSYAVLIDHMQTVLTQGGLYGELEELDQCLAEYEQAKVANPARAHTLKHLISDTIKKANIDTEIKFFEKLSFDEVVKAVHDSLSRIRDTRIQDGMHIFGELPDGERRVEFINSILAYDPGDESSLRAVVTRLMGLNLAKILEDRGGFDPQSGKSHGKLLEEIEKGAKAMVREFLNGASLEEAVKRSLGNSLMDVSYFPKLNFIRERVMDIDQRISESHEIKALLHGFEGGFIPPGPSGLIIRGRDDVLPTGRNFYSLDPEKVPTRAAWRVGVKLAEKLLEKHLREEGRYPENVAIQWMANDIMWADGEGMAQILHLIGTRPLWQPNGRIKGFEIISLKELARPRIDITIRLSGITRDNFPGCMELLDQAIQKIASLPEPLEMNFVRKHAMEKAGDSKEPEVWRGATFRLFAPKPETYGAGAQLAVYASAWKEEKDLAEVFVLWNGYAYGKGVFGREAFKEFAESLRTVDITYNKVVSDEYDLFSCCGYFGTQGGMTAAANHFSGKKVQTYYGDTRDPEHVEVRDLADEIRRVVRTKILNPKWIEGMKRHGYKGAGEISKRIGRIYGWEATTQEVDDWIFNDIAQTFILDAENRKFFEEHNPWALEEIGRRLLEAYERGLWKTNSEIFEGLQNFYLKLEGILEKKIDAPGDLQGGAVDILTATEVAGWRENLEEVRRKIVTGKT